MYKPIIENKFNAILNQIDGFETRPRLAVAVSGGADSMALMLLAYHWAKQHDGDVVALTVDHGLRKESADEAAFVQQQAKQLGITHHTLDITIAEPQAAIQQQARELRYQALEQFCQQQRILHLLTAHHMDDNVETLAMRAWRGSGIDGLAGIPLIRYSEHLRILRPLLATNKQQLINWLEEQSIPWIEDPSNQSDDYERNRIRKYLAQYPVNQSDTNQFLRNMAIAKSATEQQLADMLITSLRCYPQGYLELNTQPLLDAHEELVTRLLANICYAMGSTTNLPRHYELDHLLAELKDTNSKGCCLAGLQFSRLNQHTWLITREFAHIAPPINVTSGQYYWDNRFMLKIQSLPASDQPYRLETLGAQGLAKLKEDNLLDCVNLPRLALVTLPAIWHLDQPAFVPHIKHINSPLDGCISVHSRWRQPCMGSSHYYMGL